MQENKPNLTHITFVTAKREGASDILIAALKKPVWDFWPHNKEPYKEDDSPTFTTPEITMVQYKWWGDDNAANLLWEKFMDEKEISLKFMNGNTITISANFNSENSLLYSTRENVPEYSVQIKMTALSGHEGFEIWQRELNIPTNLKPSSLIMKNYISGYEHIEESGVVKPYIQPAGLIDETVADLFFGYATEIVRPSIWHISFTAREHQDKFGSVDTGTIGRKLRGFVMGHRKERDGGTVECAIEFVDDSKTNLTQVDIDPNTGTFYTTVHEKQIASGRIAFRNSTGKRELNRDFYLEPVHTN